VKLVVVHKYCNLEKMVHFFSILVHASRSEQQYARQSISTRIASFHEPLPVAPKPRCCVEWSMRRDRMYPLVSKGVYPSLAHVFFNIKFQNPESLRNSLAAVTAIDRATY
jgi:hypothetical protein